MSDFKKYLNFYEFDCELPGNGEVIKFKPVTTGQIKGLLTYENEQNPSVVEEALDGLINSSVITEGFDIDRLYLQDRFFLLVELRKKTKGESYRFTHTCPNCKTQTLQNINIDQLPVKKFDNVGVDNILKINDNISIELGHITRSEQKKAFKYTKINKNMGQSRRNAELTMATHASSIKKIITPEGEIENPSFEDKLFLLENTSTSIYEEIRNWFSKNDFGLDFSFEIECRSCGNKIEEEIPVENFFF